MDKERLTVREWQAMRVTPLFHLETQYSGYFMQFTICTK